MNDRVNEELLAQAAARAADDAIDAAGGGLDFAHLITIEGDRLVTNTRAVAKEFKKAHKNVLRSIDKMRASSITEIAQHARLNFEPSIFEIKGGKNSTRQSAEYLMTKDGFTELTMSFTGDKARLVRIKYIAAFNKMALQLQGQGNGLVKQFFEVEIEYRTEKDKVSAGARSMRLWQKTKPKLKARMNSLRVSIQLKLGFNDLPPDDG